ncbi:MAG: multidrug effflux MFS transporter [Pseudotabrizicola sp.]|uniref:multidrug effflux MFS transporter n=1 Tax=Pseudotabrizicola sp. TaxID=2939647 RepID=UPI002731A9ED|nr:multidrug effflux MFS transporter [Pseudotabrizicola sp.]MDP2079834.1 multidrug effflux MFS transporter [Pseudotabrizicola sp.]MDZ7574835.1 multidrug effflux MFS transporter [Pseudotabrizicola sp.]
MSSSLLRPALVLGLLSCVGPFAIDMYLPAMPDIGADLGTSVAAMQGTITAYFLAFGVAQLFYGPWADQAGRKPPLYAGLAVFLLGTLICTLAPSITWLTMGRFVQGLGGAAVMVVPRAIIRDMATGHQATRLMAAIMLVISVSPMLAPLAGAGVMAVASWRWIFGVLAVAALLSLLMIRFVLAETLPPMQRQHFDLTDTLRGAKRLLSDRGFMALTFLGGFAMASFFVFIASGPFVYTQAFGLSPTGFSLAFAVNAIGFFAASQLAAGFGMRFGAARVVRVAVLGFFASTVSLVLVGTLGFASLPVVLAGLFVANAFLGLVIPTVMVLALEEHGDIAGLASSLGGTLQMLAGGVMIALTAPFFDGTALPMLAAIAVCGTIALALSRGVRVQAAVT